MKFKIGDSIILKTANGNVASLVALGDRISGTIRSIEGPKYVIQWDRRKEKYLYDTLYNHHEIIDVTYDITTQQVGDNKLKQLLGDEI